jgi:hypothetical protein
MNEMQFPPIIVTCHLASVIIDVPACFRVGAPSNVLADGPRIGVHNQI